MRLALMTPALEEETVTSWSFTLSERLEELFSSMVPPAGRKTLTELPSARPMAVERVLAPGSAMPATLPSAVRSRTTVLPTSKLWMDSRALSRTVNSCPSTVIFWGALGLGSALS